MPPRSNCLVTRFDIKDGIAQSRGLVLDTPGATVLGAGTIDLRHERLNLHLDTQSKQVNLANLAVPMNVDRPSVEAQRDAGRHRARSRTPLASPPEPPISRPSAPSRP